MSCHATGVVAAKPIFASATSLTVNIPEGAITGPVLVQSAGQSSASQIVEVIASTTSLVQSSVTVTAAAAATGVDIYVPPPALGLSLTLIGIGEVNGSMSASNTSVEVIRGQTKDLKLIGTGLTLSAHLTVTVSGSGVTAGSIRYQSGAIQVTIAVDATAPAGARNVVVTNSSLDTAIMTGGLFIR